MQKINNLIVALILHLLVTGKQESLDASMLL